jgi:hypothetical protein
MQQLRNDMQQLNTGQQQLATRLEVRCLVGLPRMVRGVHVLQNGAAA